MKFQKYIISAMAVASLAAGMTSCSSDFIDEDLITSRSTDYFQTQDGIDDLVTGAYSCFKWKFGYAHWSVRMWPIGTDEFTDGNGDIAEYNGYMINSSDQYIGNLWSAMYDRIEAANLVLKYIDQAYDHSATTYNTRKGEAYFIRGYCMFDMIQQYGGIVLKTEASDGINSTEFERSNIEDCYAQVISDLEQAYNLLPTNEKKEAIGRITKEAAAHYIAKAKLFRQSELYADWNSKYKEADLKDVIAKSDEVIKAHHLCDNYLDLWNYTQPNGANEKVSEVVLAAQFDAEQSTIGRFGNQMATFFPSKYSTLAGCQRDISGARDISNLRTTDYSLDVFDRVNDSRFWKSFITTYGCNKASGAPTWPSGVTLPAGAAVKGKRFLANQLAIKYVVNDPGDTSYVAMSTLGDVIHDGVMEAPHTFVRYFKGEIQNWKEGHGNCQNYVNKKYYLSLSKYRDGYRQTANDAYGSRDCILARSAEDYLFAAEAYARQGNYAKTVDYLNKLRTRAAYKAGEDRAMHVDGGQAYKNNPSCDGKGGGSSTDGSAAYYETNTYFESNKLIGKEDSVNMHDSKTAMFLNGVEDILNSPRDNAIYEALTDKTNFGSDVTFSKVMNFILNERTRELCGELLRWPDLARCKALKGRWEAFNDGCVREGKSKFEDYMYLRPIPQSSYIDLITNEDAASQQNPGY